MGCRQLGDLCFFYRGSSIPRARMHERGDYLYIHYGDLYKGFELRIDVESPQKPIPYVLSNERIKDTQWLRDQDIVCVLTSETVADLGHSFIFNNPEALPAVAGTETTIVRVDRRDLILPSYLNYFMQTSQFKALLRQYVKGMKVFRVHPDDLARIEINLPSLDEQRKAVAFFDALFNKQLLNMHINDYLGEITEVLFKHEILETIDDSWSRASLLDIANYKNGLAMQKFRPEGADPGLPVLKIKELGQGYCAEDAERCRSDIDESVRVHDGDLIFSWSGTLLLNFWAGGNAGLNQHLFKVSSEKYEPWFYYLWTNYHMRKFIALAKDRATTMGHIKRSALAESEVYIPGENKMVELGRLFNPLIEEMVSSKIESRKLSKLRDVLLPRLMSGEVDVGMIEVPEWPI